MFSMPRFIFIAVSILVNCWLLALPVSVKADNLNRDVAWQITEIYIAVLGYTPDGEKLYYWVNEINSSTGWTPLTVV